MKPYIEAIARRWAVMDGKYPDDIELGFVYNKDDPRPRLWECYAEDVAYLLEAIEDDWEIVPKGATSGLWVSPEGVSSVKNRGEEMTGIQYSKEDAIEAILIGVACFGWDHSAMEINDSIVDQALSELMELIPEDRKWQPMDTAPKDGSLVLMLLEKPYHNPGYDPFFHAQAGFWDSGVGEWTSAPGYYTIYPLYWQPIDDYPS